MCYYVAQGLGECTSTVEIGCHIGFSNNTLEVPVAEVEHVSRFPQNLKLNGSIVDVELFWSGLVG